ALAQHYGVPTRLLDWSDRPLVAAFFAARSAAKNPSGKLLSVWALNLDWIINVAFPDARPAQKIRKMSVYVVTAPRATNPNLHAQGGVFTTENLVKKDFPKKVAVSSVNVMVQKKWKAKKYVRPVMAHVTLPGGEAKKLLRLLNQIQINSATIFPGYQGVAKSLEERTYSDKRERTLYWLKP
ncbi:MAG: FRG domain-containing protein, partial [Syntrophaceae bacterium]|nr:FRG domain-containing protein [Syntrophaceae bacterium]